MRISLPVANFEGVGFPGWDGFLGTRASLMLDVVFVAMIAVTSVMIWSIYQVRRRRKFLLHKRVQLVLAGALVIVVSAFEIDIRLYGWQDRAAGAPGGPVDPWVWRALYTHLFFAITTTLLWPWVIYRAWKLFPKPPRPGDHSSSHIFWARLAALDMLLTALTGWIFYGLAFVS